MLKFAFVMAWAIIGSALSFAQGVASGTGVLVSNDGKILTNAHVVQNCVRIQVTRTGSLPTPARIVAADRTNDLALLKADTDIAVSALPSFRRGARVGETVFAFGYPLAHLLAKSGNFTTGSITAKAGLKDDTTKLQFSAPIQPGNSGGPLFDQFGNVVGIVVATVNVMTIVDSNKALPQNVNFAIKSSVAMDFLEAHGVTLELTPKTKRLEPSDIADRASEAAVYVECSLAPMPPSSEAAPLPAPGAQPSTTGRIFRDCPDCPEMVVVPSGSFMMGSPVSEVGRNSDEGPQHEVAIRAPLAVGRFAVTRGEFAAFVAATGYSTSGGCFVVIGTEWKLEVERNWRSPGFSQSDRDPVVCVNWNDAKAYASWLSRKTGKTYRLPSEAEREYVTRAGTMTPFWWGWSISTNHANYNGQVRYGGGSMGEYRARTVPVDTFAPNPWGLYQVHGNVWEWVEDCWHASYEGAPMDGSAWTAGDCGLRVARGGSWFYDPRYLRASLRGRSAAVNRYYYRGFRLARTLD